MRNAYHKILMARRARHLATSNQLDYLRLLWNECFWRHLGVPRFDSGNALSGGSMTRAEASQHIEEAKAAINIAKKGKHHASIEA